MFFEKIRSMKMSLQPTIWQIICNRSNKNNTKSNYELVPWLKKFEKNYTVHHLFVRNQEFQY